MRLSKTIPVVAVALLSPWVLGACGSPAPTATASVSGTVRSTAGAPIVGAFVSTGSSNATTDGEGRFELQDLPVGRVTLTASAPRFGRSR